MSNNHRKMQSYIIKVRSSHFVRVGSYNGISTCYWSHCKNLLP